MNDRVLDLSLQLADECGALAAVLALAEIAAHTAGRAFVAADVARAATMPEGDRLRRALEAAGCVSAPRSIGRFLQEWAGPRSVLFIVENPTREGAGTVWRCVSARPRIHVLDDDRNESCDSVRVTTPIDQPCRSKT